MNTQSNIYKKGLQWGIPGSLLLVLALLALISSSFTNVSAAKKGVKVGLISDYVESAYNDITIQGLMRAEELLGIVEKVYIPANGDYETAIRQCAIDGNALCLSLGFWTAEPAVKVAEEYPQVFFAVVDGESDAELPNLRYLTFNHRQAGYLAGIVAGKMTITNKLGVVGGMDIPPVVDFAEGFRNAAQCSNPTVEVQIEYTGTFSDPALGAEVAEELIAWGADAVFNVAGATGNGAIIRASELGAFAVGVDTDQYLTTFLRYGIPNNNLVLTSAMKNPDIAVYATIEDFVKGRFTPGVKMYDLSNNGVGIAPFHEQSENISLNLANLVKTTRVKILSGEMNIYETCR